MVDASVSTPPRISRPGARPVVGALAGSGDAGLESTSADEIFRQQAADFSGLHDLIVKDPTIVGKLRELVTFNGGFSCPDAQVHGGFREMDNLVKMADVLGEAAVSLFCSPSSNGC